MVEVRARDGGLHEVGAEPGFDALGLACADVFLEAAQLAVAAHEDDALRRVLVHGLDKIGHAPGGDVHVVGHFDLHDLGRRERAAECEHIRRSADEEDALADSPAAHGAPVVADGDPFAHEEEHGGECDKNGHDGAAVHPQFEEVGAQRDDEAEEDGCAAELAEASADGLALSVLVEALRMEADRAEGDEDEKQPLKFAERKDGGVEQAEAVAVEAEPVRAPERRDEQKRVNDLEELQIEFLTAA